MKRERSTGIARMKLMVVLLSICAMMGLGQEPDHKQKKAKKPVRVFVDTTIVNERFADTIYLQQSLAINILDSLIKEQKK